MQRRKDIPESVVRKLYEEGKTQLEIAELLGCCKSTVGNRMRAWKMSTRKQRDYTLIELSRDLLYKLYIEQGRSMEQIALQFDCSITTVHRRLREFEIPARPYATPRQRHVPDEVFASWTPSLSYIVGLIASDGCLLRQNPNAVQFTSTDLELIELFRQLLQLDPQIHPYCRLPSGQKPIYAVVICDWRFRAFLENVGLTPAKSKTIAQLDIPDQVFPDFMRGCMDGDGCWTIDHSRPPQDHLVA